MCVLQARAVNWLKFSAFAWHEDEEKLNYQLDIIVFIML